MLESQGAALLKSDARAVKARLEHLSGAQGGGPVKVGFNTLAAACRIDRRRVQEAMNMLLRLGLVSRAVPADPNIGRPAAYLIVTPQGCEQ